MLIIFVLIFNTVLADNILPETLDDLRDIVNNRELTIPDEHEQIDPDKIGYKLYTRKNVQKATLITDDNLYLVDKRLDTKILIHGWLTTSSNEYDINIKDAYLTQGNYNIFLIDWDQYARVSYGMAYLNVPEVAHAVAAFILKLLKRGFSIEKFHVVGHSLGAHMSGFIGQEIQQKNNGIKLPRITGLDPAGPLYYGSLDQERLSRDDAEFVDVIHSNGAIGGVGITQQVGTVDFYPNGGGYQSGCIEHRDGFIPMGDRVLWMIEIVACCHIRSQIYWAESVASNKFVARKCDSYLDYKTACYGETAIMGDGCKPGISGRYYLDTNKQSSYARGEIKQF